jgi:hypothetical protein
MNETAADMQSEVLAACEQAGRLWAERFQSEIALCSESMAELAAARSASEFMDAYSHCLARRFRMAADDAQRLYRNYLQLTQAFARPFMGGGPSS